MFGAKRVKEKERSRGRAELEEERRGNELNARDYRGREKSLENRGKGAGRVSARKTAKAYFAARFPRCSSFHLSLR